VPRPERPLHPHLDPLHAFAARLRALRSAAGNPTYGRMARLTGRSSTALAEAAGGDKIPTWETLHAYATACNVDSFTLVEEWERLQELRDSSELNRALLAAAPPGLTNLSRLPTVHFVGRDTTLDQMSGGLAAGTAGACIGSAVHGLGGIGKSEAALQFAAAHLAEYSPTWWVAADTSDNVVRDLAALTRSLEPAWPSTASDADAAGWALRWLRTHPAWLIVLDNVTDPAVIEPVLTAAEQAQVIVTSRRDLDWAALGLRPVGIPVLDRECSVELIVSRTGRETELEQAGVLAALVGDLPLALNHVVAYLNERPHVSMAEYERRFHDHPGRLLARLDATHPAVGPIDRTWGISLLEIARRDPLAETLLDVAAYLQPDRIPAWLLTGLTDDELAVDDALALAASFTMLFRSDGAVSVHRLVQLVIRLGHDSVRPARTAVDLLLRSVPPGNPATAVDTWPRWNDLIPHVESIHDILAADGIRPDSELMTAAGRLLVLGGMYLQGQGRYNSAIAMLEHAIELFGQVDGVDGLSTLEARAGLAIVLWSNGRFQDAIAVGSAVWEMHVRVLGPDHPVTLNSAAYLGIGYRESGRLEEALEISLRTLASRAKHLGEQHPDTLQSSNITAGCYRALGLHEESLELYRRTAEAREKVLGTEHFDTLQSLNNLAGGYLAVGQHDRAMELYRSTLQSRQTVLGPHHPDTLHSMHNLAIALRELGDEQNAMSVIRAVLDIRTALLGPDHPDTHRAREFRREPE